MWRRPRGYEEDTKSAGLSDREPQFFSVDEVAHYSPCPDPQVSFKGMSWLTAVLREVGADVALTEYKTTHVQNGAQPGLIVKYPRNLSEKALDALKKRFAALYAGPGNAGKTLILDEGADVTVAGSTLEQLQFTAVQAAGVERIAAAAMVPLEVLGLSSGARGTYQDAMRRFADLWARPAWRGICASLQHLLPDVTPQPACGSTSVTSRRCVKASLSGQPGHFGAVAGGRVVCDGRVHPRIRYRRRPVRGYQSAGRGPAGDAAGCGGPGIVNVNHP